MNKYLIAALILLAGTGTALAQKTAAAPAAAPRIASAATAQPVTISAAKSLQWDRKAKTYTAIKDVIAKQGNVTIHSDTLTAHYLNDRKGGTSITTLDADGHVTIDAPPYKAVGEHAVYTVKTGDAVLTGKSLEITSDDGSVLTAKDRIEYNNRNRTMTAFGSPEAFKSPDTLTADVMSATFTKNAAGKMTAQTISAQGHVVIKTLSETITGDSSVYNTTTQKAVLTGNVRIWQGKNWLQGTRADIDMKTGISRLSEKGDGTMGGRVTGVFYPQSRNNKPAADLKTKTP